jgi:hypothetical protein
VLPVAYQRAWRVGSKWRKRQDSSQYLYRSESICVLRDYSPGAFSFVPHEHWWMGSNGYMMVDGIQVHKGTTVSRSKSGNVWIYSTVCTGCTWNPLTFYTGYTWSPLTFCTTLSALAALGAHSPGPIVCPRSFSTDSLPVGAGRHRAPATRDIPPQIAMRIPSSCTGPGTIWVVPPRTQSVGEGEWAGWAASGVLVWVESIALRL